jgi:hypothetical protein
MSYPELWKLRDAHFEPDREDSMAQFKLAFDQSLILKLAARYSYQEDVDALQAGKGISKGRCTRANLEMIFEWKTNGRGRSRLTKNTDKEIFDALKLATTAKTDQLDRALPSEARAFLSVALSKPLLDQGPPGSPIA